MDICNLIKMANHIGAFFGSHPDLSLAPREICLHLKKFWAPQMRTQLLEHAERTEGNGLRADVLSALKMLRDERGLDPGALSQRKDGDTERSHKVL